MVSRYPYTTPSSSSLIELQLKSVQSEVKSLKRKANAAEAKAEATKEAQRLSLDISFGVFQYTSNSFVPLLLLYESVLKTFFYPEVQILMVCISALEIIALQNL